MILHLNRSERAAVIRALDSWIDKIEKRRASDTLKPNDEVDGALLGAIRREVLAGVTRTPRKDTR